MPIEFTLHQKQAINVKNGNILVSAAAGSGKTAVLTQRVISLLTGENPIPADKIIVCTYTVAAADEMRRRINEKLAEKIQQDPTNQLLQSQQLLLSNAKISSIHALCSALIHEHFQDLSLSEDIKIADKAQLSLLQNDAVEEVFESYYEKNDKDFLSLIEFCGGKDDKRLFSMTLNVYEFIRAFPFPITYLDNSIKLLNDADSLYENAWVSEVFLHIKDAIAQSVRLYTKAILLMQEDNTIYEKYSATFQNEQSQLQNALNLLKKAEWKNAANEISRIEKLRLPSLRKPENPDLVALIQDLRKRASKIIQDIKLRYLCFSELDFADDKTISLPQLSMFFKVIKEVYQLIEDKKRELDLLDYSDLEHFALKLLLNEVPDDKNGSTSGAMNKKIYEKSEIGLKISEENEIVMVDECQDVNEVQDLIFKLLSKDETNLYMVGDVKQSIYRFRQACPTLFMDKKEQFLQYNEETHDETTSATINLEANFRSRSEVCDTVNYIFSQLMTADLGEIDYQKGESLINGAIYNKQDDCEPELHIIDYNEDDDSEKSIVEARYVAKRISDMVKNEYKVFEDGTSRPCKYSDFAILLRRKKNTMNTFSKVLNNDSVPCICDSTEGYFSEYEITVALNLLRIIDNPLLDVALLSVLLSPVIGFSADEITEIRLLGRKSSLYSALCTYAKSGNAEPNALEFLEMLGKLRQSAAILSVSSLLQEIYDKTDFAALFNAASIGISQEQKDANLRLLLQYATQYEKFGVNGLSGFLRYIDRVIGNNQDFSCANVNSETANAVSIMSIHSSKGLEFPICILCDTAKMFNKQDLNVLPFQTHSKLGFSMKISDGKNLKSYTPFPYEAIRLKREKETLSEEMRVLYVALTRAKEKLIMVMTLQDAPKKIRTICDSLTPFQIPSPYEVYSAKSFSDWLLMALVRHPNLGKLRKSIDRLDLDIIKADFPLSAYLVSSISKDSTIEDEKFLSHEAPIDDILATKLQYAFEFKYKNEELTHIPEKLTVTQLAKREHASSLQTMNPLQKRPTFMGKDGLTPAQKGTVLHRFMQFADFIAAKVDLDAEIARLLNLSYFTKEEAAALDKAKISNFLNGNLCKRMLQNECKREYKFNFFLNAGEAYPELETQFFDQKILLQGIADCIIFEEDYMVLIDYKTDHAKIGDDEILIKRYENQMRLYKSALSEAFSMPVNECIIYSLALSKEIKVEL